jgi:hypothetical protein
MRKILLFCIFAASIGGVKAQVGYTYLSGGIYQSNNNAFGAELGFETSGQYERRWAFLGNYFQANNNKYREYLATVYYKPTFFKARNNGLRGVFGGGIGSTGGVFVALPTLGTELFHIFRGGTEISLLPNGAYSTANMFQPWRLQIHLSIKIPLL